VFIHPHGLWSVGSTLGEAIGNTVKDDPELVSFSVDPNESAESVGNRLLADPAQNGLRIQAARTSAQQS
jgi:hypothetical protein